MSVFETLVIFTNTHERWSMNIHERCSCIYQDLSTFMSMFIFLIEICERSWPCYMLNYAWTTLMTKFICGTVFERCSWTCSYVELSMNDIHECVHMLKICKCRPLKILDNMVSGNNYFMCHFILLITMFLNQKKICFLKIISKYWIWTNKNYQYNIFFLHYLLKNN